MFFSGDSSTRKRVDLGGRSSKERDRKKLVEQTKLERNRRHLLRLHTSAALKIQKCFRGRKIVEAERAIFRERFFATFGNHCQNVGRDSFGPDSDFLPQLIFFFNPKLVADVTVLVDACQLLRHFIQNNAGEIVSLFAGTDYSSYKALVNYRVKKFASACIMAIHEHRLKFRDQLMASKNSDTPAILLLEALHILIDNRLPWACNTVSYLMERNIFSMFRNIVLTLKEVNIRGPVGDVSSLEHVVVAVTSHVGQSPCICPTMDPRWSFSFQMLTVPFLWSLFPRLREIFSTPRLGQPYFHHMALHAKDHKNILPEDVSNDLSSFACLSGNMLEAAGIAFAQSEAFGMIP